MSCRSVCDGRRPLTFTTVLVLISIAVPSSCLMEHLIQVQAVCRHGARSPLENYPTDPYRNLRWTTGRANLVPAGVQEQYRLGVDLRRRYPGLFPWRDCNGISVTSSDRNRTRDSAAALLLGLYAGTRHGRSVPEYFGGALPQERPLCPVATVREENDYLLRLISEERCPALILGIKETLRATSEYATMAPALRTVLQERAGMPDPDSVDIVAVFDTLRTQRALGLQLPAWTEEPLRPDSRQTILQAMEIFFEMAFAAQGKAQLKTLSAGGLMRRLLDNMSAMSPAQFELFSAHDTTLAALESSLGVYEGVLPTSSCLLFELYSSRAGHRRVRLLRRRGDTASIKELGMGCHRSRGWCFLQELWRLPWLPRVYDEVRQFCQRGTQSSSSASPATATGAPDIISFDDRPTWIRYR